MIYRIDLKEDTNAKVLVTVANKHMNDLEGLKELYNELISLQYTETYNNHRIYYIASTLTENNIQFEISKVVA